MKIRNLYFRRGDRFRSEIFEHLDADDAAVDLTGYTLTSDVKIAPHYDDAVFSFGVSIVNAAEGAYRLTADPADTDLIPLVSWKYGPTRFVYDVQKTNDAEPTDVETILGGAVYLSGDVT